jgi:DNA-directed RNA polymerase specialized sigma24 family protein
VCAINRIRSCIRDQTNFGDSRSRSEGYGNRLPVTPIPVDSDDPIWNIPEESLDELVRDAYFEGRVHDAVEALPPRQREYVRMRFWELAPPVELRESFGTNAAWYKAKSKLADSLGDLVD